MNTPTDINDETLMAYADGELDASQAAQVEQLLQTDPRAAAQVAQHRALRAQLRSGFSAVLSEPLPERLLSALQPQATSTSARDKVVDLAQVKQRKAAAAPSWRTREWAAIAASLIVGAVLGVYALSFNSTQLVSDSQGTLVAQGKLDNALTTQLAAAAGNDQAIQIGISFRNQAGDYCRSFTVHNEQALAGLACRNQNQWRVQVLTATTAGNAGDFRQAASATPAAVLSLIDQQIAGEPLDGDAEKAARQEGWR